MVLRLILSLSSPDNVIRHEFRVRAENLHIVTIAGDSMEPILSQVANRIMIDTSQRVPVPPVIFVIWDGIGIVAKRVEHVPHSEPPKMIIKSLNPEYQTYERDAEEVNIRAGTLQSVTCPSELNSRSRG